MAGGLFGRPFEFNVKCIVFSMICMALFLYKPNINSQYVLYMTLFIIFVIAYVAMAWYDYYFNCDIVPLKRGKYSLTGKMKPPAHVPEKQEQTEDSNLDRKRSHYIIYAVHLLFIVPLLTYIAVYKGKINKLTYPILGVLAIFTAAYHGTAMLAESKTK